MTSDPSREDDLHAFIDGQLDPEQRARVFEQLASDADARHAVDDHLRIKAALAEALQAKAEDPKDPLTERLQQELARRLTPPRQPTLRMRQLALAASLIALGWFAHSFNDAYRSWKLPPMVGGAAQAHQMFAEDPVRPVELPASASDELAAWFGDHLGETVEIPDLDQIGLAFVGGRLLGTEHGPLAQMLYEDRRGRRLSLYLSTVETDAGPEVRVVQVDGFTAGYWKGGTLVYTIVAETPTEQLLAIATEIGVQAGNSQP